jgi:hypothetical protein
MPSSDMPQTTITSKITMGGTIELSVPLAPLPELERRDISVEYQEPIEISPSSTFLPGTAVSIDI